MILNYNFITINKIFEKRFKALEGVGIFFFGLIILILLPVINIRKDAGCSLNPLIKQKISIYFYFLLALYYHLFFILAIKRIIHDKEIFKIRMKNFL